MISNKIHRSNSGGNKRQFLKLRTNPVIVKQFKIETLGTAFQTRTERQMLENQLKKKQTCVPKTDKSKNDTINL
ncbi:hypothetical protein KUTeg_015757 [Tegillarca granosa]|uniref:Uncharacterized protein n=1 Tax=Tegillarca granosa TaxID=220873 RepID=A0ABQ9ES05_TEGGR|nr:hypothetical protein KUTeg_015757 [Tegillarca granosa]